MNKNVAQTLVERLSENRGYGAIPVVCLVPGVRCLDKSVILISLK
jgi:hypothetical protein